jgi:hypothetical protein
VFILEQKQVASLAMIPIKDAREKLYKMLSDGYVQLQVGICWERWLI